MRGRTNQAEVPNDINKIATSRSATSRRTRIKKKEALKRMWKRASTVKRVKIKPCFAKTNNRYRPKLREAQIPKPTQEPKEGVKQEISHSKGTSKYKVGSFRRPSTSKGEKQKNNKMRSE